MRYTTLLTIIFVLALSSSSAAQETLFTKAGDANDSFGLQVFTINDITSDGIREVVITAPGYDAGLNFSAGDLSFYNGDSTDFIGNYIGGDANYVLGLRAENLGDINGDGFDEYAYYEEHDDAFDEVGRVRIYSSDGFTFIRNHNGFEAQGYFGQEILAIGDLNGNDRNDYILYGGKNSDGRGRIVAYEGSTGSVLYAVQGTQANGRFGQVMRNLGDIDDDGVNDFVVSGFNETPLDESSDPIPTLSGAGRVHVLSGATGATLYIVNGRYASIVLGITLGVVGDVTGDGYNDFVAGDADPSAAFPGGYLDLVNGKTGELIETLTPGGDATSFASTVVSVGDVTGDGKSEFAYVHSGLATSPIVLVRGSDFSTLDTIEPELDSASFWYLNAGDFNQDGKIDLFTTSNFGAFGNVSILSLPNYRPDELEFTSKVTRKGKFEAKLNFVDNFAECSVRLEAARSRRQLQADRGTLLIETDGLSGEELTLLARRLPRISDRKKSIFVRLQVSCSENLLKEIVQKVNFKRVRRNRTATRNRVIRMLKRRIKAAE